MAGHVYVGHTFAGEDVHLFHRRVGRITSTKVLSRARMRASPAPGQYVAFLILAVKIDTDAAYQTALKEAADYEKKNPGKTISFLLEKATSSPIRSGG